MPGADEWSDDEIILALASCPREKQSYSPRHKNVLELADLIGRSPGAVSHHFANISHLIHGGKHGEAHVGTRTRELFAEYTGREDKLRAKAAEIRRNLMADDPTPRVEKPIQRDKGSQLTLEILEGSQAAGLPEGSVATYEREGSWYLGIVVDLAIVLVGYPDETTRFLKWLGRKLEEKFSRSKGYDLALAGKWQSIAEGLVSREAPSLHQEELRPQDRVTLALRIPQLGSLRRWRPAKRHLSVLARLNRDGERRRLDAYLGIDSTRLCDMCLLMLKDLVDRSIKGRRPSTRR